jgi:DNA-nicking Smr family endonuclease
MKFSALDELGKVKKKFPKKRPENVPETAPLAPADDAPQAEDVFAQAMAGVTPLSGRHKGREVLAEPAEPSIPPRSSENEAIAAGEAVAQAWVATYLRNLVQGHLEFELKFSEEYMHGHIQGLDRRVLEQLKAGQFSVEAHLDLHGLNAFQAKEATHGFLRAQYYLGRRCVLLIPGRGRNSPAGLACLREELPLWLAREPLRRTVLAFCTALPRHGGAGAVYVLLRKFKKTLGKVRWDLPASTG